MDKIIGDKITGLVHIDSEVRAGQNWEGEKVVEFRFIHVASEKTSSASVVVVDRATAARLINQLRRVLDT